MATNKPVADNARRAALELIQMPEIAQRPVVIQREPDNILYSFLRIRVRLCPQRVSALYRYLVATSSAIACSRSKARRRA